MKLKNKKRDIKAKDLAAKYCVSTRSIVKYFSQDREDYIKEQTLRRAEMYKLKQDGLKLTEIADRFNITKSCVSHLIKKHKERYANQVSMF